jgi:hypothetical protein
MRIKVANGNEAAATRHFAYFHGPAKEREVAYKQGVNVVSAPKTAGAPSFWLW